MRQPTPEYCKNLLSFIPKRPDYETWIKIISAIGNTFDYNTSLNLLLSHFEDEKPNEHAIKLQSLLKDITFGTLIYFAKQNGYKPENSKSYESINYKPIHLKRKPDQIKFIDAKKNFLYRFKDERIEERIAILEYEGNLSRLEAERIILKDTPETPRERVYRIAVNNQVKNKTTDYKKLNDCFENQILTVSEIAENIGNGFSIICSRLKVNDNGKVLRNNESWLCSELIALDIDTGLSIDEAFKIPQTKHALMIYTSPSHTPSQHRFRIIFDLPYLEINNKRYASIIEKFISIYNADKQCKDTSRIYFGNNNSTIFLLRTSEILKYKNGVLLND